MHKTCEAKYLYHLLCRMTLILYLRLCHEKINVEYIKRVAGDKLLRMMSHKSEEGSGEFEVVMTSSSSR